jgi:hypothetical protein
MAWLEYGDMNAQISFPAMRAEVLAALRALSDPIYQRTVWGRYVEGVDYYDDLDLEVHILYDDCRVLPSPEAAVPAVLYAGEVSVLRAVEAALGPMLSDLGDRPRDAYIADPRWADVVRAAHDASATLQANDRGVDEVGMNADCRCDHRIV